MLILIFIANCMLTFFAVTGMAVQKQQAESIIKGIFPYMLRVTKKNGINYINKTHSDSPNFQVF